MCALAQDADMSPFEAARKLLDADSQKMSLSAKADLVFQVLVTHLGM
jgi:hypothetical protein